MKWRKNLSFWLAFSFSKWKISFVRFYFRSNFIIIIIRAFFFYSLMVARDTTHTYLSNEVKIAMMENDEASNGSYEITSEPGKMVAAAVGGKYMYKYVWSRSHRWHRNIIDVKNLFQRVFLECMCGRVDLLLVDFCTML